MSLPTILCLAPTQSPTSSRAQEALDRARRRHPKAAPHIRTPRYPVDEEDVPSVWSLYKSTRDAKEAAKDMLEAAAELYASGDPTAQAVAAKLELQARLTEQEIRAVLGHGDVRLEIPSPALTRRSDVGPVAFSPSSTAAIRVLVMLHYISSAPEVTSTAIAEIVSDEELVKSGTMGALQNLLTEAVRERLPMYGPLAVIAYSVSAFENETGGVSGKTDARKAAAKMASAFYEWRLSDGFLDFRPIVHRPGYGRDIWISWEAYARRLSEQLRNGKTLSGRETGLLNFLPEQITGTLSTDAYKGIKRNIRPGDRLAEEAALARELATFASESLWNAMRLAWNLPVISWDCIHNDSGDEALQALAEFSRVYVRKSYNEKLGFAEANRDPELDQAARRLSAYRDCYPWLEAMEAYTGRRLVPNQEDLNRIGEANAFTNGSWLAIAAPYILGAVGATEVDRASAREHVAAGLYMVVTKDGKLVRGRKKGEKVMSWDLYLVDPETFTRLTPAKMRDKWDNPSARGGVDVAEKYIFEVVGFGASSSAIIHEAITTVE